MGHFLNDVKKNYKTWLPKSKSLSNNLRKNFSYEAMKKLLIDLLDQNVNVPSQVQIKLPNLKEVKLPTLQ